MSAIGLARFLLVTEKSCGSLTGSDGIMIRNKASVRVSKVSFKDLGKFLRELPVRVGQIPPTRPCLS
jgi:hypothetical protein